MRSGCAFPLFAALLVGPACTAPPQASSAAGSATATSTALDPGTPAPPPPPAQDGSAEMTASEASADQATASPKGGGGPVASTETSAAEVTVSSAEGVASSTSSSVATASSETSTATPAAEVVTLTPQSFTLTGTVNLASFPDGASTDGLSAGPVAGALVFVAGFPDQQVLTDSNGAFTLQLSLDESELGLVAPSYQLLAWKITDGSNHKYGRRMSVQAEAGDSIDVGALGLRYTEQVKLAMCAQSDFDANACLANSVADCDVEIPAYDGRLNVVDDGNLRKIDYLPDGEYTVEVVCPGFVDREYSFSVSLDHEHLTSTPNWRRVDIPLTPE